MIYVNILRFRNDLATFYKAVSSKLYCSFILYYKANYFRISCRIFVRLLIAQIHILLSMYELNFIDLSLIRSEFLELNAL